MTDTRPDASIETVDTYPQQQSLSLQLAPDSTIYHITRDIAGGGVMHLNRINQPDSLVDMVNYEADLFDNIDPQSSYFSQFIPQANIQPTVTIGVQQGTLCQNTPIQFYPIIDPPTLIPDNVSWDFQPNMGMSNKSATKY